MAGVFDCFGNKRSQLMSVFEAVIDSVSREEKSKVSGQFSLFELDSSMDSSDTYIPMPDVKEYTKQSKLKLEKQVLGIYLSGHPLDNYIEELKDFTYNSSMLSGEREEFIDEDESMDSEMMQSDGEVKDGDIVMCGGSIENFKKTYTKNGNKEIAIIRVEDLFGTFTALVSSRLYEKTRDLVKDITIISITHDVEEANNADEIIILDSGKILLKDKPSVIFSNYKLMKEISLDVPFEYKIINLLKENNVDIKSNSLKELEDELCQ